jgi:hypothetical protein
VARADGCFGGTALAVRGGQQPRRLRPPLSHTVRWWGIILSPRAWICLHLVAILIIACLGGCTNDEFCPRDCPPTACIRMGVIRYISDCPLTVRFLVNPDCSGDDCTPYENLQIRWDFGADGAWDTDFGPMKSQWGAGPSSVAATMWRVRCEVRDLAGQTSQTTDSLDLRPLLPRPPDIIAGRIRVTRGESSRDVDTVLVGESFWIWIHERCWIDPAGQGFLTEYRLDGQVIGQDQEHVTPPLDGCWASGRGFSIAEPGTHQIQVTLDATNVIVETDETNNIATKRIVVVDAPPNKWLKWTPPR